MNKEDARAVLNVFLSRNHLELVTNVKAYVLKIVESIEPEYEKVVLPEAVGEQWDKLVASQTADDRGTQIDYALSKLGYCYDGYHELFEWWQDTPDANLTLIYARKYGWVPEPQPDKLYRVYVPGTDQVYVYTHRVWSDRRVHLEVQEIEEQSDEPTELFTMIEIQDLNLEDYEREEVTDDEV